MTQLTTGQPVPEDRSHEEIDPTTGQQRGYVVLTPEERAKGFVRPLRRTYVHVGSRPTHPTRALTPEEHERYDAYGYVSYESYVDEGADVIAGYDPPVDVSSTREVGTAATPSPVMGRFWTLAQLRSGCGEITTMSTDLAETYAREPSFYGGTFCATCRAHFPVGEHGEFVWLDDTKVGT